MAALIVTTQLHGDDREEFLLSLRAEVRMLPLGGMGFWPCASWGDAEMACLASGGNVFFGTCVPAWGASDL